MMTKFLNTEMIAKEWKISAAKFILDGKVYLIPLSDGMNVRSSIALTTELEYEFHK